MENDTVTNIDRLNAVLSDPRFLDLERYFMGGFGFGVSKEWLTECGGWWWRVIVRTFPGAAETFSDRSVQGAINKAYEFCVNNSAEEVRKARADAERELADLAAIRNY